MAEDFRGIFEVFFFAEEKSGDEIVAATIYIYIQWMLGTRMKKQEVRPVVVWHPLVPAGCQIGGILCAEKDR